VILILLFLKQYDTKTKKQIYLYIMEKKSQEWMDKFRNELMEISLDINLDYMGGCNGDSYSIAYMITQINNDLRDVLYKFIVDKKTLKFRKASDNDPMLTDGLFIDFIYKIDEKHEAKIYYKYEYDEYL